MVATIPIKKAWNKTYFGSGFFQSRSRKKISQIVRGIIPKLNGKRQVLKIAKKADHIYINLNIKALYRKKQKQSMIRRL